MGVHVKNYIWSVEFSERNAKKKKCLRSQIFGKQFIFIYQGNKNKKELWIKKTDNFDFTVTEFHYCILQDALKMFALFLAVLPTIIAVFF